MTNIITGLLISIAATNFQPKSVTKALPERADGVGDVYFEQAPISTNVFVIFSYTNMFGQVSTWRHEIEYIQSTNIVSRYRTNKAGDPLPRYFTVPLEFSTSVSTNPIVKTNLPPLP